MHSFSLVLVLLLVISYARIPTTFRVFAMWPRGVVMSYEVLRAPRSAAGPSFLFRAPRPLVLRVSPKDTHNSTFSSSSCNESHCSLRQFI